jgi:hypothetical protein
VAVGGSVDGASVAAGTVDVGACVVEGAAPQADSA